LGPKLVKLFNLLVLAFMLVVAAFQMHLIALAPPNLKAPPDWLTSFRLEAIDVDPLACSGTLNAAGLNGTLKPDQDISNSCHKDATVLINILSKARMKEEQTRCNIAARLYMWERNVVQPTAQKYFGKSVKEITHFGSYNCRTIRGSHSMSEHSTANAIDISGFKLSDGTFISIRKSWNVDGPESQFLHELRNGICGYFNLTLSPDYNSDHADHFHVDMGRVKRCR
jgi:hypothetical protein